MKTLLMTVAAAILSTSVLLATGPGYQKTNIKKHPRVDQVNKRIDNQESRIHKDAKDGALTKTQAKQDKQNLKNINQEKKDMRKLDNGHLTKQDQKTLNQQLNQNSQAIGK